jgi:magnesium transporter
MGMFIISNILGSTIQITTLPLPVLSTLQASGLVFNSICATLILGEHFTIWSLTGTVLVCIGAVLIAVFGAVPEPAHNLDQLLDLLRQRSFVKWMIGQFVLVTFIAVIASGLSKFPKISSNPRMRLLRGLVHGFISGILSAHSLLVAKTAVELIVRTVVDHKNQFGRWQSWAILLSLILLSLTQLYYLHRGLKLVSTSVLYPLVFCIFNIIAILDGLIYFRQTDKLSALHGGLIALGTVVLLSGVLALSWRLSDEQTQPAVSQSALASGLGLVEDSENEEYEECVTFEEEADMGTEHEHIINGEPITPTNKRNAVIDTTQNMWKIVRLREASEIWNELDDDAKSLPPRPPRRSVTTQSQIASELEDGIEIPAESTALLRSSRLERQHRRKSNSFLGFTARPSPRNLRRKSTGPQSPTGNFWNVNPWRRDRGDKGTLNDGVR